MLLLTMFLSSFSCINARAEEFQILEIPNFKDSWETSFPGRIGISRGDCKNFKVIIDQYSYCSFDTDSYEYVSFSLYSDKNMSNKLLEFKDDEVSSIFLPKGEYYLNITGSNLISKYNVLSFTFGKISVIDFMKGGITKKKNKFYYQIPFCFRGDIECSFLGLSSDDGSFFYDTEYVFKYAYIEKNKKSKDNFYNNISFKMYLKNKNSNVKITPTGKTKEILDIEAKGETYDTTSNNPSDSTKKDKKKPTVKGVKNNKTYKKTVKIKVSDKSGIKKVTLNGKKMKVSKFKKGYKITRKKSTKNYILKVWDKAGNKRVVKFKIKKK